MTTHLVESEGLQRNGSDRSGCARALRDARRLERLASGHSHRRAAGAIFALGALTCGLGSPSKDAFTKLLAVLGTLALALLAVVTGSLPALSLLVGDIVLLWGLSTVRHAVHVPHQPRTA